MNIDNNEFTLCTSIIRESTSRCYLEAGKKYFKNKDNEIFIHSISSLDEDKLPSQLTKSKCLKMATTYMDKDAISKEDDTTTKNIVDEQIDLLKNRLIILNNNIASIHHANINNSINLKWQESMLLEKAKNHIRVLMANKSKLKAKIEKTKSHDANTITITQCDYTFGNEDLKEQSRRLDLKFKEDMRLLILQDLNKKLLDINVKIDNAPNKLIETMMENLNIRNTILKTYNNLYRTTRISFILESFIRELIYKEALKDYNVNDRKDQERKIKDQQAEYSTKRKAFESQPTIFGSGTKQSFKKARHKKSNVASNPFPK